MVILTIPSPEQVPGDDSFIKSSLPLGSSVGSKCSTDTELGTPIYSLTAYCTKASYTPDLYLLCAHPTHKPAIAMSYKSHTLNAEGTWICSTDLLQPSLHKNRPRLLPHGTKMYNFIPHRTDGLWETSDSRLHGPNSADKAIGILSSSRNIKRNFRLKYLHPKKRLLREYLWMQQDS
ncbi:hypothetical protein XENTR_v10024511 [Xenopus tropicalis]|uniref:Uncharacterized protein LOC100487334 n=1 Tax=Xenopus tropicalis TaxID=8364 RepID=A0A8J0QLG8_XENTR|nr:uncharacterized protein LOC100487334 [Xenopus tropicalis]KAE8580718.1 hypothetical protein XENTR_v10024511 [Xenopus tropicalis]KAE8580719.1 hypothetical protein XENTR_v10024511 [Xenopus tropicalis]KAE8580720.1 hypothetical protein XENTR_v10024511 [Xenopus tropicalis]|eukprot:XP_002932058.1 PREDICTED: uncharacterized protein LOC100487334 [Xenopus tropicalis]